MGSARWLVSFREFVWSTPRHVRPGSTTDATQARSFRAASTILKIGSATADSVGGGSFEAFSLRQVGVTSQARDPMENPEDQRRHQHRDEPGSADLPPYFAGKENRPASKSNHKILSQNNC